jgi:hypothetical protein
VNFIVVFTVTLIQVFGILLASTALMALIVLMCKIMWVGIMKIKFIMNQELNVLQKVIRIVLWILLIVLYSITIITLFIPAT